MNDRTPVSLLKSIRDELLAVQRKVDYLVALLDSQAKEIVDGISTPISRRELLDLDLINQALLAMTGKESQEEILDALLGSASKYADRVVLFDAENGNLQAWKGLGISTDLIPTIASTEVDSPLVTAVRTGQVVFRNQRLDETLPWLTGAGPLPASCLCVPLVFGSYIPLVLYADSSSKLDTGSLELLARLAVLQMQNQYMAHLLRIGEESEETPSDEGMDEMLEAYEDGEFKEEAELVQGGDVGPHSKVLSGEEEEAAHGEARRLARLLVAEIKLYNEEEVLEGREHSDLYRRLRTDIERSRKMYEKLVHPSIQSQADYYGAEVIRVLAKDDPNLMGSGYESSSPPNPIDQNRT
jgi:hypothetical protein